MALLVVSQKRYERLVCGLLRVLYLTDNTFTLRTASSNNKDGRERGVLRRNIGHCNARHEAKIKSFYFVLAF